MQSSPKKNRQIRLVLPFPPRKLLPNAVRKLHWGEGGKLRRDLRIDTAIAARQQKPARWRVLTRCDIDIQWYVPRRRYADRDGLFGASKSIIDALQPERTVRDRSGLNVHPGAGIIKDDSDDTIGLYILRRLKVDKKNPRVEILITEVG